MTHFRTLQHLRNTSGVVALALGTLVLPLLGGCAMPLRADCDNRGGGQPDFGDFESVPTPRMGCLPFPGLLSLYAEANVSKLGDHVYRGGPTLETLGEEERGIFYTCKGGFLDIAHIRNTMDNAAHIHARIAYALENGRRCIQFRLAEPSYYRVEITYPDSWWEMTYGERVAASDRLAIEAASSLAYHAMTWHEILTWYGYKSAVIVSEQGSAFTYEDVVSHAVGAVVSEEALQVADRRGAKAFNEAATVALNRTIAELEPVSSEHLKEAIELVKDKWWSGVSVTRRNLEIAVDGGEVIPWLVPDLKTCEGTEPRHFRLAPLADIAGDGSGLEMEIFIKPRVFESGKIFKVLKKADPETDRDGEVNIELDFPILMDDIRRSLNDKG